jgi:hypothetical protein
MDAVGFKKRNAPLHCKSQVLCLLSVLVALLFMARPADAAYGYRKAITIPAAGVAGSLSDFPVLVSIASDNQLRTVANGGHVQNSNGYDIVFRGADGTTPLPHEIESYYPLTGQLTAWVKVPALSSSADTVIYMYYGDSSVTSPTETPADVWDSNFKGVYHLKESIGTTINDSAPSANTGTAANSPALGSDGKIGKATTFDGSNDYVYTTTQFDNPQEFTIEAWFKTGSASGKKIIGFESNRTETNSGSYDRHIWVDTDGKLRFGCYEGSVVRVVSPNSYNDNQWHHVVGVRDNSPDLLYLYVDGLPKGNIASAHAEDFSGYWRIGSYKLGGWQGGANGYFPGAIDEVRISHVARSADWIRTEYNNQSSPSTFYTLGSEETVAAPVYYQITAVAGTNGTITPSGIAMVESGTSKTYTMTPSNGYKVWEARVDGVAVTLTDSQYTFTNVNQDHEISVAYVPLNTGTVTPPPSGTIPGCAQNINVHYSNTGFDAADFDLISVGVSPEKILYLDTGYYAIDPDHIVIPFTQEVMATFFYEGAGYTMNDFGWMLASEGVTGTRHEIYSNVNDNNNNGILDNRESWPDAATQGVFINRVNLGTFAAGTEIVFYLHINSNDPNDTKYVYTKKDWNADNYSGGCTDPVFTKIFNLGLPLASEGSCQVTSNWMNATALDRTSTVFGLDFTGAQASMLITRNQLFPHVVVGVPINKSKEWILGWEDLLGGGDTDHNDMIFHIERRTGGQSVLKSAITPVNAGDYYTGVTLTVYDNMTCAGKTDIVYFVSIDNGANWVEVTTWDEIWEIDSSKNPLHELTTWTPGTPALTRRMVRIDFAALGIIGRELLWKAEFRSEQQGCEPQILDVILNADVASHGSFSRSSPVTKANVLYSGFYETPALDWRDKILRGHLSATRLYDPQDPNVTAELPLWDAGQVLSLRNPGTRSIYFPQISVGQVTDQEITVGDGTIKTFSGTISPAPISATTLSITDGREIFRDKHTDVLEGNLGGRGTVNRFTGEFSLEFNEAPLAAVPIRVSYSYYNTSNTLVSFTATNIAKETLALDDSSIIPYGLVYDFDHDGDVDDTDAHWVMNWVKGYELGTTVKREWVLDPIDHSVPAVLTAPGLPLWYFGTATTKTERDSFKQFMLDNASRRTVVFAGSRSGMLHAFDAGAFRHGDNTCTANVEEKRGYFEWGVSCATGPDYGTGEELWSFIPANLLPRLKNNLMARLNMARAADYSQAYVDASPALSDVYINGAWRTVLLSAEGNGGDTVFCLDVTDPYHPTFLWEFADPDLFRSRSSPSIAKIGRIVHNGTAKWVAFFVSGNDDRYDHSQYPSVYMIDIGTGDLLSRIMLDIEPSGIGGVPSGQPSVIDSDGNGYIDRFYIGTDKGYLYKVNIPDDPDNLNYSISQCVINKSYTRVSTGDTIPADRRYQPIYGSPVVSVDNSVNENGNIDYKVLIFFGTGDSPYYAEDINMSGTRYYFLAYIDRSEKGVCTDDSLVTLDWFYELPEGHRVFTSAFSAAGLIYFGTSTADTEDPCGQDAQDNNNGEIFAFSMHQPNPVVTPAFRQRVGNVVASPMVEDQHLYVKGLGLGLQSFGRGIYNNDVLTGGWPEIGIRAWREIF